MCVLKQNISYYIIFSFLLTLKITSGFLNTKFNFKLVSVRVHGVRRAPCLARGVKHPGGGGGGGQHHARPHIHLQRQLIHAGPITQPILSQRRIHMVQTSHA